MQSGKKAFTVAVGLVSRDKNAVLKLAEFRAVRTAFDEVNKLSRQLPPGSFDAESSSRPDVRSPERRRVLEVDRAGNERLISANDPTMTGEMVQVQSSSVHAVGFELNMNKPERSSMRIQYKLARQRGGKGKVPGPVYKYSPIDAQDKSVESQESHPRRETHSARAWTCWLPQVAVGREPESQDAFSTSLTSRCRNQT